jgi:hypothetical protein
VPWELMIVKNEALRPQRLEELAIEEALATSH